MKILLLGAGRFTGSHLVEHLPARGEYEVVGLDATNEELEGPTHQDAMRYCLELAQSRFGRDQAGLSVPLVKGA